MVEESGKKKKDVELEKERKGTANRKKVKEEERKEEDKDLALSLPDEQTFRRDIQAINQFQRVVHSQMVQGHDYGIIPGTQKPTLLKPGAEKIVKLLGLADCYDILDKQEDWSKPFFHYLVKSRLISVNSGAVIAEGLGECNSMESKYRWRWVWSSEVPENMDKSKLVKREINTRRGRSPQYRLDNEDIFSQVNTVLKMAKKRALVDAALSAGRLSDVFTQDVEDQLEAASTDEVVPAAEKPASPPTNGGSPENAPQTAGELLAWVASHGKTYNRSWLLDGRFSFTAEDLANRPRDCYREIKGSMGW